MEWLKDLTRKITRSGRLTKQLDHKVHYNDNRNLEARDRNPALCESCANIPFGEFWVPYSLHSISSLISSSGSCALCRLVRYQLSGVVGREHASSKITLQSHSKPWRIWLNAFGLHMGELQWFADSSSPCLSIDLASAHPKIDTEATGLLRELIRDCLHERGKCSNLRDSSPDETRTSPPLLPRRVVDVGDTLNSSLHLHESGKNERGHYITLSHRWGNQLTFKTMIDNIEALHDSIDLDVLPLSFKDAIAVTRALGVRYLWIDAICIIQDDYSDWHDQAPLMGKIYQSSHCTLAAHSAEDSTVGFLESTSTSLRPVAFVPEISPNGFEAESRTTRRALATGLCIGIPHTFKQAIEFSHIKKRGWVLQELTLSPRVAHFSNGYIYWDCEHTTMPKSVAHKAEPSIKSRVVVKTIGTGINFVESWINLVTEYSRCELTYDEDKLFAISGIASEWQTHLDEGTGNLYHAGVFECTMPHALLWYSAGDKLKKYYRRAPSWSWASVDGQLQFMNAHKVTDFASTFKLEALDSDLDASEKCRGFHLTGIVSLMEVRITRLKVPFGTGVPKFAPSAFRSGAVEVTGFTLNILSQWQVTSPDHVLDSYGEFSEYYSGQASMDDESTMPKKAFCARVCTLRTNWGGYNYQREFLLLLEPVDDGSQRYRRIGVGTVLADSCGNFDWPELQDIVIV